MAHIDMIDPDTFGRAMGQIVREAIAPLKARLDALETGSPEYEKSEAGELLNKSARDGAPASRGYVFKAIASVVEETEKRLDVLHSGISELRSRVEDPTGSPVTKALDAQAYDAMIEMSERIDKLESAVEMVAERSVRYRGYWRQGVRAKRNESYTDEGSLWIAINTTDDRPSVESHDWCLAARKGRDAK